MTLNEKISARVSELLLRAGKNYTWLGEQLGMTRQQPGRLLSGKNSWNLEHLEKLAVIFGVPVQDIIGEIGPALTPEESAVLAIFRVDGYHGLLTHAAGKIARS